MATHSSILAWRMPWTEEPGRLQSMWSPRVGHDLATKPPPPPPVFLPGECHGQRRLAGYSPWDHKELDTTEYLSTQRNRGAWMNLLHFSDAEMHLAMKIKFASKADNWLYKGPWHSYKLMQ